MGAMGPSPRGDWGQGPFTHWGGVRVGLAGAEEVEDALGEEGGGVWVVGGERAVGEVVLVAGVEEQLGVLGLADQLAGGVDVAFAGKDGVGVHPVDLRRQPLG